jgi:PPOX class probable F420-dependent enzyme
MWRKESKMPNFRMEEAERTQFLADRRVAIVAIERHDAAPLAVPVWYGVDSGGNLAVWTERGSIKERLVRASGRFTLTVQNENPPYGYVSAEGPAMIRDATREDVRPIVERYMPADEVDAHLDATYNDKAVLITMRPSRWYTADYGKSAD